jgi:hypothetical protein
MLYGVHVYYSMPAKLSLSLSLPLSLSACKAYSRYMLCGFSLFFSVKLAVPKWCACVSMPICMCKAPGCMLVALFSCPYSNSIWIAVSDQGPEGFRALDEQKETFEPQQLRRYVSCDTRDQRSCKL